MSGLLLKKLKANKFVLIDGEVYELIGDYSEVETKYDYEFTHIENNSDTFMASTHEVMVKLQNNWKVIKLPK